ncbi:MAG: hypothetical protein WB799_11375, partial [Candidatus Sulfotelmatobacter sp.]
FRIATICSTENRLRLTANLPSWSFDFAGNSLSDWIKNPGADQHHSRSRGRTAPCGGGLVRQLQNRALADFPVLQHALM